MPRVESSGEIVADVIEKDMMMVPILAACPSFRPAWEELVEEWRSIHDGRVTVVREGAGSLFVEVSGAA